MFYTNLVVSMKNEKIKVIQNGCYISSFFIESIKYNFTPNSNYNMYVSILI